jgi:peroxiredoxin Q/BCP
MTPDRRSKLLRGAGFVALMLAVAAAGLWTGAQVRRWRAPEPPPPMPAPAFAAGDPFPSVALIAEDGTAAASDDLFAGHGGVVLFLDPDCPACTEAVGAWQALLDAGEPAGVPVAGISNEPPEALTAYRERLGIGFPLYSDPAAVFAREHGVTTVPTTVVLDPEGTVRLAGYLPPEDLDPAEIAELAGG